MGITKLGSFLILVSSINYIRAAAVICNRIIIISIENLVIAWISDSLRIIYI
jgi:hypothetical protein